MAAEVVRIPTAPHTPANEWANDTAMTLRSTINNNTLPNDTLPNNTLASNPLSNHPLPNTFSSEATSMNSTLAQPPTPGINPSVASTPGRELPGGWGAAAKVEAQTPPRSTTLYDDISNALSTVGQTAFNMIPDSLKSSVSSAHPSETPKGPTGGVGDLPGPAGEAGVAQLPLEREAGNKEPGTIEPKSTTLQTLADNTNAALESTTTGLSKAADTMTEQARGAFAGGEKPKTESSTNALPPTTVPTTFGEGAGVGDLPGDAGETSVMKLPLEREAEKKTSTGMNASSNFLNESSESDSQPRKELVSPKVEPEKSTAAAFIDRRVPTPDPDTQPNGPRLVPDPTLDEHGPSAAVPSGVPEHLTAQRISGDRDVKEAASKSGNLDKFNVSHVDPYGQQRQDAQAPSPPPKDDSPAKGRTSSEGSGTRFTEQVHPPPEHQLGDHGHGHNRSASTSSTGSKIRFRDKLKGEIKVLSGKVTKNEAKVEEGKAILAGEKA